MSTENQFSWIDPEEIREHTQGEPLTERSGQAGPGSGAPEDQQADPPAPGENPAPQPSEDPESTRHRATDSPPPENRSAEGQPGLDSAHKPSLNPYHGRVVPPWVQDEEEEGEDEGFEDDETEAFDPEYDILAPGDPLDQPPYNRPFRPGDAALANPPGKRPDRHEDEEEDAEPAPGEPGDLAAQPDTPEDPMPETRPRPRREITPPPPDVAVVHPEPEDEQEQETNEPGRETALPLSQAGPEEGLQPDPPEVPPSAEDHPSLEEAAPAEQNAPTAVMPESLEQIGRPPEQQEPMQQTVQPEQTPRDSEPEPAPQSGVESAPEPEPARPASPEPEAQSEPQAEPQPEPEPALALPEITGRTPEEKLNHLAEWAIETLDARQVFVIDGDGNTVVGRNATRGMLLAASQMFAAWVHLGRLSESRAGGILQAQLDEADRRLIILRSSSPRAEGALGLSLLLDQPLPQASLDKLLQVFNGICREILENR